MKYSNKCYNCPCFPFLCSIEKYVKEEYKINKDSPYYYDCGAIYDKKFKDKYGFSVGSSRRCLLTQFINKYKIPVDESNKKIDL